MVKDYELYKMLATNLVQYNQHKIVAKSNQTDDIAKFCDQQIITYANGIYNAGHFDDVIQTLEDMKQNSNPETIVHIEQSIKDLHTEQHASQLVSSGLITRASEDGSKISYSMPSTQAEQEDSYAMLKENANSIPDEFVQPVALNLQTKLDTPHLFAQQTPVISNALSALAECRLNELTDTAVQ